MAKITIYTFYTNDLKADIKQIILCCRSPLRSERADESHAGRSQSLKPGEERLVDIIEEAGGETLDTVEAGIRQAQMLRSVFKTLFPCIKTFERIMVT